ALLRLCSVWNVPVACTPATADLVITSPLFLSPDYKPVKPNF
ncbi:MAG: methylglyoxal synthase, partial [Pseudomonadota bacterium]|nr:methylglyoxal synthase [Pseudomonadota bacterium]